MHLSAVNNFNAELNYYASSTNKHIEYSDSLYFINSNQNLRNFMNSELSDNFIKNKFVEVTPIPFLDVETKINNENRNFRIISIENLNSLTKNFPMLFNYSNLLPNNNFELGTLSNYNLLDVFNSSDNEINLICSSELHQEVNIMGNISTIFLNPEGLDDVFSITNSQINFAYLFVNNTIFHSIVDSIITTAKGVLLFKITDMNFNLLEISSLEKLFDNPREQLGESYYMEFYLEKGIHKYFENYYYEFKISTAVSFFVISLPCLLFFSKEYRFYLSKNFNLNSKFIQKLIFTGEKISPTENRSLFEKTIIIKLITSQALFAALSCVSMNILYYIIWDQIDFEYLFWISFFLIGGLSFVSFIVYKKHYRSFILNNYYAMESQDQKNSNANTQSILKNLTLLIDSLVLIIIYILMKANQNYFIDNFEDDFRLQFLILSIFPILALFSLSHFFTNLILKPVLSYFENYSTNILIKIVSKKSHSTLPNLMETWKKTSKKFIINPKFIEFLIFFQNSFIFLIAQDILFKNHTVSFLRFNIKNLPSENLIPILFFLQFIIFFVFIIQTSYLIINNESKFNRNVFQKYLFYGCSYDFEKEVRKRRFFKIIISVFALSFLIAVIECISCFIAINVISVSYLIPAGSQLIFFYDYKFIWVVFSISGSEFFLILLFCCISLNQRIKKKRQ